MSEAIPLLKVHGKHKPYAAIFLSGGGSNAEQLLLYLESLDSKPLTIRALVTDAPETSNARALGKRFKLPVIESDIRKFYMERGETRVSIATEKGQQIRTEWTNTLRKQLAPLKLDFAVFAGFVPLTNLTQDFPCLNVHPGDLTYLKDGRRFLIGLHTIPIERAILEELTSLRSSVIIAQTYTGMGSEMDNGLLLGMSGEVPVDLQGQTLHTFMEDMRKRPSRRPKGGFADTLEEVAKHNQERLKQDGDWVVLPRVVCDYAEGRFGTDSETGKLMYKIGTKWHAVQAIQYTKDGRKELIP